MFAEKESKYTKVIQNQRADIARLEAQLGDVVSQVETIEWQVCLPLGQWRPAIDIQPDAMGLKA